MCYPQMRGGMALDTHLVERARTAMAFIRWSEAMSVGVSRLDRDHKILIGLINRLDEANSNGGDGARRVMADALEVLVAYTIFHFSREEAVMEACGYPAAGQHHDEHAILTQEVRELQKRFHEDVQPVAAHDVLHFLKGWLNHHILLQDMAYRPFTQGHPAADAAAEAYGMFDFSAAVSFTSEADLEAAS